MGHYAWGGYNGTSIYDPSGQALNPTTTATCTVCHDTHTSTQANLMQDGLVRGQPDAGHTAVNENTCVAVCHQLGGFDSYGHGGGKPGISSTLCTPCHDSNVSHRDTTDGASARRLSYNDAVQSNLTYNRAADGLDNDMDGLLDAGDANEGSFAYSKTSNCKTCHMHYAGHGSGVRAAACMDCHDPHGDASAANNNDVMLRSSLYGENTVFTAAQRAAGTYYIAGNTTGACDNDACHNNMAGNLATAHRGGAPALSLPCSDCHTMSHTAPGLADTDSSFMANRCDSCHGYPPAGGDVPLLGISQVVNHTLRRRGTSPSVSTDADFLTAHNGCTLCHGTSGNATLDGFANTEAGGGARTRTRATATTASSSTGSARRTTTRTRTTRRARGSARAPATPRTGRWASRACRGRSTRRRTPSGCRSTARATVLAATGTGRCGTGRTVRATAG